MNDASAPPERALNTILPGHGKIDSTCPCCGVTARNKEVLTVPSLIDRRILSFVACSTCGTRFVPNMPDYAYESYWDWDIEFATRFYVEQGASIDTLALPALLMAKRGNVSSYLDVGCGFGFGVDFASKVYGWETRGIDPSPIAARGRQELGIDIDARYLTEDDAKAKRYDAIVACEVVEHIKDPLKFLRICRASLAPQGSLVLTTPDGEVIDDVNGPRTLGVLSPGFHAVLFNAESLARALRTAGFSNPRVITTGATLIASATAGGPPLEINLKADRRALVGYFDKRWKDFAVGSPLWTGFLYRLFKEHVNAGRYDVADGIFEIVAEGLRSKCGIDLNRPRDFGIPLDRPPLDYPCCIQGLLYFRGISILNREVDVSKSIGYFMAALATGVMLNAALHERGVNDGEMIDIVKLAANHIKICAERLSP